MINNEPNLFTPLCWLMAFLVVAMGVSFMARGHYSICYNGELEHCVYITQQND